LLDACSRGLPSSVATINQIAAGATQSVAEVQDKGRQQLADKSAVRPSGTGGAGEPTTWPVPLAQVAEKVGATIARLLLVRPTTGSDA